MFLQLLSLSQDFVCLCIQEVVLMKLSDKMYLKKYKWESLYVHT